MLEISQGPAVDMADKLHRFGSGQVSEQLMGQALDDDTVGMIAENETNICECPVNSVKISKNVSDSRSKPVRQRTIGSPARDYIPLLRIASQTRHIVGKLFGIKEWASDDKAEKARQYRSKQQAYINKLLDDLKDRVESGDETPSILGNIFRQGLLSYEEVLLASYTGSKFFRRRYLIRHIA